MKINSVILLVGVFAFLNKMALMVYEVSNMNFEFDLLGPDDASWVVEYNTSTHAAWKKEIEALEGLRTKQEEYLFL
ncbi:hypothetical protein WJR50_31180 [Catalinimonas sp. 4WD22]|uniref:hypothetical protein n=1 Tax=Catalinimonas locisalis TaxID=3133978 RepID=UPI003101AAB2